MEPLSVTRRVISPRDACGDDAKAIPINVLARKPPAGMMLIHASRPDSVQKKVRFSVRANTPF
jgi:hypothetical protein